MITLTQPYTTSLFFPLLKVVIVGYKKISAQGMQINKIYNDLWMWNMVIPKNMDTGLKLYVFGH